MKILLKAGITSPGTTSNKLASRTSGRARPVGSRRASRASATPVRRPPAWNSGPGSNVSTTPVKPESKSSQPISRGPVAGSFTATLVLPNRLRTPSTTMKCWKARKMITGLRISASRPASIWKPLAIIP